MELERAHLARRLTQKLIERVSAADDEDNEDDEDLEDTLVELLRPVAAQAEGA